MNEAMEVFNYNLDKKGDIDFGDYVLIEQFRYDSENEMYLHKVINTFESNTYVSVPVKWARKEIINDDMVKVVSCICCGVDETKVLRYRVIDVVKTK